MSVKFFKKSKGRVIENAGNKNLRKHFPFKSKLVINLTRAEHIVEWFCFLVISLL